MSLTAREVRTAIEEFDTRLWDEDHELYDEDEGEENVWSRLYDEEEVEIPGLGVLVRVASFEGYDETRTQQTVVFTIEGSGRFFSMEGWYDSWGGEEGWDGPFTEVKQVEVLRKEWHKV